MQISERKTDLPTKFRLSERREPRSPLFHYDKKVEHRRERRDIHQVLRWH